MRTSDKFISSHMLVPTPSATRPHLRRFDAQPKCAPAPSLPCRYCRISIVLSGIVKFACNDLSEGEFSASAPCGPLTLCCKPAGTDEATRCNIAPIPKPFPSPSSRASGLRTLTGDFCAFAPRPVQGCSALQADQGRYRQAVECARQRDRPESAVYQNVYH